MKNIILLLIAIVLFGVISPFGIAYTIIYYAFREKGKGYKYTYRCAFSIDVLSNCMFGELFELVLCKYRGCTYFGTVTSISAAMGDLLLNDKMTRFGWWFSGVLDRAFREKDHCVNAYKKEILK